MKEEGNFKLNELVIKVQGKPFKVSPNNLLNLRYAEDIRRSSIHLEVTLTDSEDALMSKVFGMEPISISFSDAKDNVIDLSMIVYEVTNREIVGGKQMKATLRCCNEDVTNAAGILISSQFEDKNITDIVKDLLSKSLNSKIPVIKTDQCINKFTFVTNYWNPIKIIQWLTDKDYLCRVKW